MSDVCTVCRNGQNCNQRWASRNGSFYAVPSGPFLAVLLTRSNWEACEGLSLGNYKLLEIAGSEFPSG